MLIDSGRDRGEVCKLMLARGVYEEDRGRSWSKRCTKDPSQVQCGTGR